MSTIVIDDLTSEELLYISDTTGCGAKALDVPDWIFLPACQEHDLDYWIGGDVAGRSAADRKFLKNMLKLSNEMPWWSRYWYRSLSYVYYWAVRLGSAKYFWYGDPRGRSELDAALELRRTET